MAKYQTIQGDTWDMISYRVYKTEKLMHLLIGANAQYKDIAVFSANCELNIPAPPQEEKRTFPPWKRNA